MNAPISVLIPAFNSEKTIVETIESILNQSLGVSEIIVSDDGSTDNTINLLQKINDSRVQLISNHAKNNPGIMRQIAFEKSTQPFIALCDADDVWLNQKIEIQFEYMLKNNIKFCSTNAFTMNKDGEKVFSPLMNFKSCEFNYKKLLKRNEVINSSAILHREILEKVGGFDCDYLVRSVEDYSLFLRASYLENLFVIDVPLIFYRDIPESSIRNPGSTNFGALPLHAKLNFLRWLARTSSDKLLSRIFIELLDKTLTLLIKVFALIKWRKIQRNFNRDEK